MTIPDVLSDAPPTKLITPLPQNAPIELDETKPTYIYNFYNLDPEWDSSLEANRVLLLEPSVFAKYPVSQNTVDFIIKFAKENIPCVQVFVGEFGELTKAFSLSSIYFKEHPLNTNYNGVEVPRDWMFQVHGYYPSFFSFWKKCKKQLKY
jgi:deoxyribodipyrimidine photo-lyase